MPGMPHHIYLQGNNRQDVFDDEEDYRCYLDWLREGARQYGVDIHAYSLLKNRVYLMGTPSDGTGLARMVQWIGRHYVPYFNRKYHRSGTLWEGRFKTSVVEPACLLSCCRYMEMTPVMYGLADSPEAYEWSSYRHHVGISPSPLIRDHVVYWDLGNTPFGREMAYRELFNRASDDEKLENTLTMGWPLGSAAFIRQLEISTERRFRMGKRGRPEKSAPE